MRKETALFLKSFSSLTLEDFGDLSCGGRLGISAAQAPECAFQGIHARHLRPFHACTRLARKYRPVDSVFDRPPSAKEIVASKVVFQDLRYMTHATRLIAAVAPPGAAAVSTASTYLPRNPEFVHFYAALLNSSLANGWYKARDVSRSIKLYHLRELPVVFEREVWQKIGDMARKCAKLWMTVHRASHRSLIEEDRFFQTRCPAALALWNKLIAQIDEELFDLYGLSSRQRKAVCRFVRARTF